MGEFDAATWQALGLVLTIVGLALSVIIWTRRGAASGLRAVAWSLLPLAAGLTGVLRLGWEITDAVVDWAARLVFSPVVWLGVAVAGLSLALFLLSGLLRRRSGRSEGRGARGQATAPAVGAGPAAKGRGRGLPRDRSAPAATPPAAAAGDGRKPPVTKQAAGDDMSEIEDILRRHGIS